MSATLVVRHTVADYAAWRKFYDGAGGVRAQHGCTADRVLHLPGTPNDVLVIHEFSTVAQAQAFAGDPALKSAMEQGGVAGAPRIEIFESV